MLRPSALLLVPPPSPIRILEGGGEVLEGTEEVAPNGSGEVPKGEEGEVSKAAGVEEGFRGGKVVPTTTGEVLREEGGLTEGAEVFQGDAATTHAFTLPARASTNRVSTNRTRQPTCGGQPLRLAVGVSGTMMGACERTNCPRTHGLGNSQAREQCAKVGTGMCEEFFSSGGCRKAHRA